MDTDTLGLIVLIASVIAVLVAARRAQRKARQAAQASENHVWRECAAAILIVTALPAAMRRATRRSQGTSPSFPGPPTP